MRAVVLFIPVSVVKKVKLFSLSLYPPALAGFFYGRMKKKKKL